jgi:hypothetical protein
MSDTENNKSQILFDALTNSFFSTFPNVNVRIMKYDPEIISVSWYRDKNDLISFIQFRDFGKKGWSISGKFYPSDFFDNKNITTIPRISFNFISDISLHNPEITIEEFRRICSELIKSDIESRITELSTNIDELLGLVLNVDPSAYSDEMLNFLSQIVETGKSLKKGDIN